MPEEDPRRRSADGPRCLDIGLLLERERDAAHEPRKSRPAHESYGEHGGGKPRLHDRADADGENQARKREKYVEYLEKYRVHPAAVITRDHAEKDSDTQREERGGDAHRKRYAAARDHTREDVSPLAVRAERVVPARGLFEMVEVNCQGIMPHKERPRQSRQNKEKQQQSGDQRRRAGCQVF